MFEWHRKEKPFFTGITRGVGGAGFGKAAVTAATGASVFPTAYQSLINSFATKYYVSTSGSDSNSGTEASPYATIGKAISVAGNNQAIIIQPGSYTVTNSGPGSYGERMFAFSTTTTIIGAPGRVTVTEASNLGARDNHIFGMRNIDCKIYGLIIKRDNNGRANNYETAMWGYDASDPYGEVYNCVIQELNANGTMSHFYDNTNSGIGRLYNCTIVASNWLSSYSGSSSQITQNTALTSSNPFSLFGTSTNNVNGVTINPTTYSLTNYSNSTYGVYSGTYAWQ